MYSLLSRYIYTFVMFILLMNSLSSGLVTPLPPCGVDVDYPLDVNEVILQCDKINGPLVASAFPGQDPIRVSVQVQSAFP